MTDDAKRARLLPCIRRAGLADVELLAALGRRTFEEAFGADNRPEDMAAHLATAFVPAEIAADLARPEVTYLVADRTTPGTAPEAGAVRLASLAIGYALLAPEPHPPCVRGPRPLRLVKLYVVAAAIGAGVGGALLAESVALARRGGYGSLWLGVWEHNHRARAFYARWGFREVGTEPFQLGSDLQTDLLLERPVL